MKPALVALLLLATTGCGAAPRGALSPRVTRASTPPAWEEGAAPSMAPLPAAPPPVVASDPMTTLTRAAAQASPGARRVLDAVRAMLEGQVITRGSCYTWVNAVFRRAGGAREAVFDGDRRTRWADASTLRPGDWVFFINHSYGDVTHSAIFVAWVDERAREALMVSYPGERRVAPGRFSTYALTNVYRLVRLRDG